MELALMFKSTIAVLSVAGELIVEPFEINHDIEGVKLLEEKMAEEQVLLERKKKEEKRVFSRFSLHMTIGGIK